MAGFSSVVIQRLGHLGAAMLLIFAAACSRAEPEFDLAAYEQEILDWRAERLAKLVAPNGYLTQIGLHWLEEGSYTIGSAAGNDIVVPATAAPEIGALRVSAEGVRLLVSDGVEVLQDGHPVHDVIMNADTSEDPVLVSHGSLAWSIIDRAGKLAVRVRDYDGPFVKNFGPLPYYDIDPGLRVTATLEPYEKPRTVAVDTVIEGFQQFPVAPGVAVFELDGQEYELEPTISGDGLFFVFGDLTNRDDTYGAGRFIDSDLPGDDGRLVLDFNKSYSPPCAFNDFSTCPVASPRNRLPVRIEAGETFDPALHYAP
jgi:hypothetical protein